MAQRLENDLRTSNSNKMKIEKALQKATRKAIALMKRGHVSAYIQTLVVIEQLKQELVAIRNNQQVAHS